MCNAFDDCKQYQWVDDPNKECRLMNEECPAGNKDRQYPDKTFKRIRIRTNTYASLLQNG